MEKVNKEKWSIGDIFWLLFCIAAVVVSSLLQEDTSIFSIIAGVFGVIYTICIMKNNKNAFLFGIVNVLFIGILLFNQKVYSGAFYNIVYSLPMLVWGYIKWGSKEKEENSGIKFMEKGMHIFFGILLIVIIFIYAFILKLIGSNHIFFDAATSVLGYCGIYLMSNKYLEQWNLWIISNFINVLLWGTLSIEDSSNIPVLIMWIVYLINSVYGGFIWRKKYKKMMKD